MKINIKIVQGNSEVYIEGETPEEIIQKLNDIEKIINKVASFSSIPSQTSSRKAEQETPVGIGLQLTPTEVLNQSNARTAVEKIMVLVYYLFKQGTTLVNVKDMNDLFKQVMEPQPQNWGGMLNHLSSKGWLAGGQKKDKIKAWSITRTGLEYVEKNLLKKEVKEA